MNKQVQKLMETLDLTEQEALQLIEDDKAVDRMSMKEVTADLTDEQKKAVKKATQSDRKPTVYQFQKRERKANNDKRDLVELLRKAVEDNGDTDIVVLNVEREIEFTHNGKKYKITLSAPRS